MSGATCTLAAVSSTTRSGKLSVLRSGAIGSVADLGILGTPGNDVVANGSAGRFCTPVNVEGSGEMTVPVTILGGTPFMHLPHFVYSLLLPLESFLVN